MRLASVALVLVACNQPYLTWSMREPLATRRGHVAIAIDDQRVSTALGRVYGFGGVAREITIHADEPRARLERLLAETLYTAGIGSVAPANPPTARIRLELDTLRCDGMHLRARSEIDVALTVTSPAGETRLGPERIALSGQGRGCEEAFSSVLDQLIDELGARFVEGPAHDAALGIDAMSVTSRRGRSTPTIAAR